MDDIVGEIMSETAARDTSFAVLDKAGAPGFLKAVLFNERNIPLRQALHLLPNYDAAMEMRNTELAKLA